MPFLYMEASPQLRGRARQYGRNYRKMALVEVEPGYGPDRIPKMITARARGVVRVVDCATLHVGTTDRSAGRVWRSRMLALCAELNAAESDTPVWTLRAADWYDLPEETATWSAT
jgi:hypothetical protein